MNGHNRTNRIVNYVGGVVVFIFFCSASLVADDFMYWEHPNFNTIVIPNISSKNQRPESSSSLTLYTSGDAEIMADNSAAAQLHSSSGDTLITEYKLSFDGHGSGGFTGGTDTSYETYDNFLKSHATIRHVPADDDVVVTLSVRASNYPVDVADAGKYAATQTLTVVWDGGL